MISNSGNKATVLYLVAWATVVCVTRTLAQSGKRAWNFDQDMVGKMPTNFASALTGQGTVGRWEPVASKFMYRCLSCGFTLKPLKSERQVTVAAREKD